MNMLAQFISWVLWSSESNPIALTLLTVAWAFAFPFLLIRAGWKLAVCRRWAPVEVTR